MTPPQSDYDKRTDELAEKYADSAQPETNDAWLDKKTDFKAGYIQGQADLLERMEKELKVRHFSFPAELIAYFRKEK